MKIYIIITLLFCASIINAQTTPGKYAIKNVSSVNTDYADFGTSYFGKDSVIFSSPTKRKMIRNIWKPNEQPYLDLYLGKIGEEGDIVGKQKVKGNVNTKYHESNVVFTEDRKTVYYTGNNNYQDEVKNDTTGTLRLQLYKAKVMPDGKWEDVEKLPFNNNQFSTGHPALSKDGKKLYFVSDRPESIGKTDIYVVDINDDGSYSSPKNLGKKINTVEKEMFPFIVDDIIYYSSEGHNSAGGLDVFANKMYDTTVSRYLNIGEPINSTFDDFSFILKDGRGYLSSNREEGIGGDDIYSFLIDEPLYIKCTQQVMGVVKNNHTQEVLAGAEIKLLDKEGKVLETVTSDKNGVYHFTVNCNSTYKITGDKTNFKDDDEGIITVNDIVETPINIALALMPEVIENKINIENIYFDLDKSRIRPDAAAELDKLVQIMEDNPELIIEATSHTDSRQSDTYNNRLSSRRAKSTRRYIISKGISRKRITAKGYGETQLTNKCSDDVECTDEEHQANRRTEFIVVDSEKLD
ncbi:MAG: OmpA family protein [Flavobacteriaceae bacterium]|nr:OmpA family protein [Flavobacteriaceae bacterium]